MGTFAFDIRGQLNSMQLAESKALWPLFEAVVNSIQAIEDSQNKNAGAITIYAKRVNSGQQTMEQKGPLEKFESFSITDNGTGFDTPNYNSFLTAYSTLKIKKGCKGIGRFLWLKAFNQVEVNSTFQEEGKYFHRGFIFNAEGINPENNCTDSEAKDTGTTVKLCDFSPTYRNAAPVELDAVARKIIEHCLPFFLSDSCPQITIMDDDSDPINLNKLFNDNISDSLDQDRFNIEGHDFTIYHLRIPEGVPTHQLHLCANLQEVATKELKIYIPDLQKKIIPLKEDRGFFYVGYITSKYLDSIVNTTRTNFEYDEKNGQVSLLGVSEDAIIKTAVEFIKGYLADYISDIKKEKQKKIDDFVAYDKPMYRYLLQKRPEVYDEIPAGLKADALDLELHKHVQRWERELKLQGKQLESDVKDAVNTPDSTFHERFEQYWAGITELSKTCLAEYVTRRKTILTILEDALTVQDDGKFKKEEAIHSVICPMQHTSDDIQFEEMNLWIVDERLAYHQYLASDKTLKSMPYIESNSRKEPDIAIFDRAFAYSDSDEPFSTVTIVEFKKPDNDAKNPINQVGEYVDLIRQGRKEKANGNTFSVNDGTLFRCYVICDLTDKMRTHCMNASLSRMPDNMGYTGFNRERNAYFEVISYTKLLADAKRRNQILFDKLFEPKLSEVIHVPNQVKEAN